MDYSTSTDSFVAYDNTPPPEYVTSLEAVAPSITQKIAQQGGSGESWTDTLQRVLPMLAATVQQKEILSIQLARAKAGLPPLDNSQFGVGVSVGLSPDIKNYLMIGGIAALAMFLMSGKRK